MVKSDKKLLLIITYFLYTSCTVYRYSRFLHGHQHRLEILPNWQKERCIFFNPLSRSIPSFTSRFTYLLFSLMSRVYYYVVMYLPISRPMFGKYSLLRVQHHTAYLCQLHFFRAFFHTLHTL